MTNLNSILKSRDITLPIKFCIVKSMVFPVVMYGCESWTTKKAEHQRTDVFELCPLDCKEIKQSILKEICPEWCWSWSFNTLAIWCEELTHWKRPWWWETLKAGGEGDERGWDGWMASLPRWTWVWASSGTWWWTRKPGMLQSMGSQRAGHDWTTELNW